MYWECYINNDVGSSRVPIIMKNLTPNKYDCDNICDFIEQLSVKAKYLSVNVDQEACGLEVLLVSDRSLTKS